MNRNLRFATLFVPFAALTLAPVAHAQEEPAASASASKATPFTQVVLRNFAAWDADHDGTLSKTEVEAEVRDPKVKGEDAAAIATLNMLAHGSRTAAAPTVTKEYLTQYAANPRSTEFPAFNRSYEICVKRIAATPSGLYASSATAPQLRSVCQGMLGDCFFVSVVGAMLNRDPAQVKSMIVPRPDGSSDVVFPAGQHAHVLPITDAEVALSGNALGTGRWLATLESGFANIRRDMRNVGTATATTASMKVAEPDPAILATDIIRTGGSMHEVVQFLTGHAIGHIGLRKTKEIPPASEFEAKLPAIRAGVSTALRDKRLVGTGTGVATEVRPAGISPNHAYAIVGFDAATDTITLWNPHGQNFTPKGTPGLENGYPTDHGVFQMPLIDFTRVFAAVNWELNESAKGRALTDTVEETPE